MAKKVVTTLEDDLIGGPASKTVTFGLEGATYEIDLNDSNAAALRDALSTYIAAGRKVGVKSKKSAAGDGEAAAIRAWAKANGHAVPERGRIPAPLREAYAQAR